MKKITLTLAAVIAMTQLTFADPGSVSGTAAGVVEEMESSMTSSIITFNKEADIKNYVPLKKVASKEDLRVSPDSDSEDESDDEGTLTRSSTYRKASSNIWPSWITNTVNRVLSWLGW